MNETIYVLVSFFEPINWLERELLSLLVAIFVGDRDGGSCKIEWEEPMLCRIYGNTVETASLAALLHTNVLVDDRSFQSKFVHGPGYGRAQEILTINLPMFVGEFEELVNKVSRTMIISSF